MATGAPVNDAQILVNDIARGSVGPTRTEVDGTYVISLAPGQYKVRVRAARQIWRHSSVALPNRCLAAQPAAGAAQR
jgi:hypothetical protein